MSKPELFEHTIMAHVGLRPWHEFLADRAEELAADIRQQRLGLEGILELWSRRTGKTTRMLIAAVQRAAAGTYVKILSTEPGYDEKLTLRARQWCEILSIPPERMLFRSERPPGARPEEPIVLWDHYAAGR